MCGVWLSNLPGGGTIRDYVMQRCYLTSGKHREAIPGLWVGATELTFFQR